MSTLSDQQIIALAFERLTKRDAEIFVWHHWGRPDAMGCRSLQWTYSQLVNHFKPMSFSTVSASLKASRVVMVAAVREQEQLMSVEVVCTEGLPEEDVPISFRRTLQFGHEAKPREDVTAKSALRNIGIGRGQAA